MRHHHDTRTRAIDFMIEPMAGRRIPIVLVCAIAACMLAAGASKARAERFELGMGASIHQATSSSVHAVHDGTRTDFSLTGAVPVARSAGLDILIDATLDTGAAKAVTFQRMDTETRATIALLGARARLPLTSSLSVHGRAALGMSRVAVDMHDSASFWSMSDSGYAGSAYAGAGVDFLPLQPGASVSAVGVRLEVGYLRTTPVALGTATTGEDGDALIIPTAGTDLGDLDLSAITTRLTFVGRF